MNKEIIDTEEKEPLDIKEQEKAPRGISPLLIIGIVILFVSFASGTENPTDAALLFSLSLIIIILDRLLISRFDYSSRRFDYSINIKQMISRPTPFLVLGIMFTLIYFLLSQGGNSGSGDFAFFKGVEIFLLFLSIPMLIVDRILIRIFDYKRVCFLEFGCLSMTPVLFEILFKLLELMSQQQWL